MERRILYSGIMLAASIAAIIGVVFFFSGSQSGISPIRLIPQNASLVLRMDGNNLMKELSGGDNQVWNELSRFENVNQINQKFFIFDSLLKNIEGAYQLVSDNEIYLSGHMAGGSKLSYISYIPLPLKFSDKKLAGYIAQIKASGNFDYTQRNYESNRIYTFSHSGGTTFNLCILQGILLYSKSPVLIEDAIRQSSLELSILDDAEFYEMFTSSGKNKDANLYVNLNHFGPIYSFFANTDYSARCRAYSSFGPWSELDVNIKDDLFLLNGFYANSIEHSFLKILQENEPVSLEFDNILSSSTNSFLAFGFASAQKFYDSYLNYLKGINKFATYKANLINLNKKYSVEFETEFLKIIDDEIVLASRDINQDSESSNYVLIKCQSGTQAKDFLHKIALAVQKVKNNNLFKVYSPDGDIQYRIYHLPVNPMLSRLMGGMFDEINDNYITVIDNYIVISNSYKNVSLLVYDYLLKKTLVNDEIYQGFADNLSMKSNMLLYVNLSSGANSLKKYMNNSLYEKWGNLAPDFSNIPSIGMQIGKVSGLPYMNLLLKHYDDVRNKPKTIWESLLDTAITFKPKFVENHYTKQKEIFVQDLNNSIYLLNQAGRIIWKVPIGEEIISDVYQVDAYKNGKLQMLFSTKNKIYLLDRNGNHVDRFPIDLSTEASAGLAVFDYDNNKNYRIFIPTTNKKILAYSINGNKVPGWKFALSDHIIDKPLKLFQVDGKDFIVASDKVRIYILDRRGNPRVKLEQQISISENNEIYINNSGSTETSYLVTSSAEGIIQKIKFDGSIEELSVKGLSEKHYFDFKDINADGRKDYIFLDKNRLIVYDSEFNEIYKTSFDGNITRPPVYYNFSYTDRKIGLVDELNKNIYLINNNGKLYKGFPLQGSTLFSIGYFDLSSSHFNLIVGGRNNFLYNYQIATD